MKDIMKRKFNLVLLVLLLAFASCSFTSKTFEDPDKDKLLIRLISYVLEEGHYSPKEFNDEFSEKVFDGYIKQLDPYKRYFYESDIKEFKAYKDQLDDEIKNELWDISERLVYTSSVISDDFPVHISVVDKGSNSIIMTGVFNEKTAGW